jgi:superfamily II DNA or RNA helicase
MELQNVNIMVINTGVKSARITDLLILDEIHNYASDVFKTIFTNTTYSYILGLTATLERKDKKHYLIEQECPVIDTISMKESLAMGYVSDFKVFNLALDLDDKERERYENLHDSFNKYFKWFDFNFQAAMKCLTDSVFRAHYAQKTGYDPNGILTAAVQWTKNMRIRKTFLYNHPIKIEAAKELINTFDVPTITFSESVKFADELTKECYPWAVSYHSKKGKFAKVKAIEDFNDPKSDIKVISTARALDEGFDIQDVSMAIVCSGTSTSRQDLQRTGRAIRWAPGKTGLIINLYIRDTQDEKWLRSRQKKTINTTPVNSIIELKEALSQASLNYLNVE